MAHASHSADTTFIVAEPDFVFYREDGNSWTGYLSERDAEMATFSRFSELAARLQKGEHKKQFLRELDEYMKAVKLDQNAPWPKLGMSQRSSDDTWEPHWSEERLDAGDECLLAFSRPVRPPAGAFQPHNMSPHLLDLQALMTAASRLGRKGFLWCGWNVCQWSSGAKKPKGVRMQSPLTGAQLSMMTAKCARELLPVWHAEPDSHMGKLVAEKLGFAWQDTFGCAYVWPPIGGSTRTKARRARRTT